MSKTSIPDNVKALLWLRAGGRCQFEGCNDPLWEDGLTTLPMNASQMAHIVADSPDGPRGDVNDSPKLAKDVSNLMLLCTTHHKLVDSKEHEIRYPRSLLEQMKENHERRIELLTSFHGDKRSRLVTYWANVGGKKHFMADHFVREAVLPHAYPASSHPLNLASANSVLRDGDGETFWMIEKLQLERQVSMHLKPTLEGDACHLSLFAVAPQPLLIYLGALLSDLVPVEVYQLHREPQNWSWRPFLDGAHPMPRLTRTGNSQGAPCLLLALSSDIAQSRIEAVLGPDLDIWTISVDGPHNDVMQSREQLEIFRQVARQALEGLNQTHPEATEIHVFPVAPVSACVEFGRVLQPRACRPLLIYNQISPEAGFRPAIRINESKEGGPTQ